VLRTRQSISIVEGVALSDGPTVLTPENLLDRGRPGSRPGSERLPADIDGQFAIVQGSRDRLDIATDDLGMYRVYWCRHNGAWYVANRVELLARLLGKSQMDLEGAAGLLSVGWVARDHTLLEGIEVVPGGARWCWSSDKGPSIERPPYMSRLAHQPRRPVDIPELADSLVTRCEAVSKWAGELEAPLTAGLDSRLILCCLRAGEVPARYVTQGDESHPDVLAARRLAGLTGVEHRVFAPWELGQDSGVAVSELARQVVAQNDGMVSLWQVLDLMRPAPVGNLCLWGIGGEIGRAFYTRAEEFISRRSEVSLERFVNGRAGDANGLLTRDGAAMGRMQVKGFVEEARDSGFDPLDARDAFYAFERVGRWAAANVRKAVPAALFAPLSVRPFVDAAFSLSPIERYSEALHFRLMQFLSPELRSFPVPGQSWRSQRRYLNLVGAGIGRLRRDSGPDGSSCPRIQLLDHLVSDMTARSMDHQGSAVWSIVDRSRFESLVRADPAERARSAGSLFGVLTLLGYEEFRSS